MHYVMHTKIFDLFDNICCIQVQSIRDEHVGSALKWREEHRRRTAVEEEALGVDNPEQVIIIVILRSLVSLSILSLDKYHCKIMRSDDQGC